MLLPGADGFGGAGLSCFGAGFGAAGLGGFAFGGFGAGAGLGGATGFGARGCVNWRTGSAGRGGRFGAGGVKGMPRYLATAWSALPR